MDGINQLTGLVFGEMLKTLRKKRGVSQQALAARMDVHRNTISKWERGECLPESRTLVLELARQLRLQESEARLLLEASLTTALPYSWNLPYQRNPFFTGREDLLTQLHSLLAAEQTIGLHACLLYGLGGIGKTQLAIEYAYRYSLEYNAVLWLQAKTYTALVASFSALTDQLGLPERHSKQQYANIEAVIRWLCEHHGWLLIVDNLGDSTYIKHVLPPARQGSVLFTAQQRYTGSFMPSIEVPPMTTQEGARFFLRRTDMQAFSLVSEKRAQEDVEALEPLVQAMEGLPLALEQAASYIFSSQCGPQRYLSLLQAYPLALLGTHDANADHALSVAATCTLAVNHVQQGAPGADALLTLCSLLAPEALAEDALRLLCADSAITELYSGLTMLSSDDLAWYEALAGLSSYSLARYEAHTRLLSVHRLVQTIVNAGLAQEQKQRWIGASIQAIHRLFPSEPTGSGYWSRCELWLPHALRLADEHVQANCDTPEIVYLLIKVGVYLYDRARYEEAVETYQRTIALAERLPNVDQVVATFALYGLANLYAHFQRFDEAITSYQLVYQLWQEKLGAEHPQIALVLLCLAGTHQELGHYEEAEAGYRRSLAIWDKAGPTENGMVVHSLMGLGGLFHLQGKLLEAETYYQQALATWERLWGANHVNSAGTRVGLARLRHQQGRVEEARTLYQQALDLQERAFTPDHPLTRSTRDEYARLYPTNNKY